MAVSCVSAEPMESRWPTQFRGLAGASSGKCWVRKIPEESLFISAVTLGEIQAGIEITRAHKPDKATEIEGWLDDLAETYNVLVVDASVFRRWAQFMHGRNDLHLEDALIAATALVRDLTVATRNTDDFKPFGVSLVNPFLTPR
jgi:predicted nucleic acid-binding protein